MKALKSGPKACEDMVDATLPSMTRTEPLDVPFVTFSSDTASPPPSLSSPPPPATSSLTRNPRPWLVPTKTEDGQRSRHLSLRRQPSNDSDFPRSRSSSMHSYLSYNESGYSSRDSSSELGPSSKSPSRSTSREEMPDWDDLMPSSPRAPPLQRAPSPEEMTNTLFQTVSQRRFACCA